MLEHKIEYWTSTNKKKLEYDVDESGRRFGLYIEYFLDGTIFRKLHYNNDELHGLVQMWGHYKENKCCFTKYRYQMILEENYINGKKNGRQRQWYYNGQLVKDCYYEDGKLHGVYQEWTYNNIPYYYAEYKDGILDGIVRKWYSDNGCMYLECTYKNGKLHGEFKSWHNGYNFCKKKWLFATFTDGNIQHVSIFNDTTNKSISPTVENIQKCLNELYI